MKLTSKETYKVVRAALRLKKFTQYQISKEENVTFSLVNKVVNWLVLQGYVAKRKGCYELLLPAAILSVFPIYRKMKQVAVFDVNMPRKEALKLLKSRAALCLASALASYDDYARDEAICAYIMDAGLIDELKGLPKGYTHIELYEEDLNREDIEKKNSFLVTSKIRTVVDLFCANKAYLAERLIKREWV